MVHTIYLDDTTVNGRKLLKELRRYKKGVQFKNIQTSAIMPEGYMTPEEFRVEAKASLIAILNEHDIHLIS
jgi:hypothetical protein